MSRNYQSEFVREKFIKVVREQPPRRKEVLMQFRQYSQEEVAINLNITESCVSKHISNFLKKLKIRKYFEGYSRKELPIILKELLNQYIDNIVADEIRQSIYLRQNKSDKQEILNSQRGKLLIVIETDIRKVNKDFLTKCLEILKQKSGDDSMTIEQIKDGSVEVTIIGSLEGCQRLKEQFDAGELTEILGIPVSDVSSVEIVTENNLWTNLRTWVQTNILSDWDIEEIVGGTIAALRANPDFLATPAFGSRMGGDEDEELVSIPELLDSLNSEDINIVRLAAQKLGEIEANTSEVINSLKAKLNTIEDVQTQWQIALSLGIIAPEEHPQAKAQKQITELGDTSLELIVATKNDEDNFVDILVEIRPDWDDYLPIGLEAKILEESGEEFWLDNLDFTQQVTNEQSYIYFSFWGTPGDRFILQLSLENTMLQKNFQI
jgi:predicted transcriptional regulator